MPQSVTIRRDQNLKVYAFHVGDTKVPYGQFYGGGEGWTGLSGMWKFLKDKKHYIIVPIYTYLVDHPSAGLILIDSGINWQQAHEHNKYYDGPLLHASLDEDEYKITHEQELSTHLQKLGYGLKDIKTVVLTHLHEDHIGGLPSLADAKVMVTRKEWDSKAVGIFKYSNSTSIKKARLQGFKTPSFIEFSNKPFYGFLQSCDLLGDGSIMVLPTPGHSAGHVSVLIRMDGCQLLCVGDTLYTLRHLDLEHVRPIALGKKVWQQQANSINNIIELRKKLPHIIIASGHDHTAYARLYLEPFLADGVISLQELHAIELYEQRLFNNNGQLPSSAIPHYVPPKVGSVVGTVTEPSLSS